MSIQSFYEMMVQEIEKRLPEYMAVESDFCINQGNVAFCLISPEGEMASKMFGTDKIRLRDTMQTAWRKASQVWITGYPTGQFEELVYSKQVEWYKFGIMKPDYIGWEGGLPLEWKGLLHAAAFSGFRGEMDVDILQKSFSALTEV